MSARAWNAWPFGCMNARALDRAEGIVTVTDRPPSFRGTAMTLPPWIATMAKPSPEPSCDVRSPSRWNGWKMRSASRRADDRAGIGHGELVLGSVFLQPRSASSGTLGETAQDPIS